MVGMADKPHQDLAIVERRETGMHLRVFPTDYYMGFGSVAIFSTTELSLN
jgi:hypothetical protein